jgi:hypothetical protein
MKKNSKKKNKGNKKKDGRKKKSKYSKTNKPGVNPFKKEVTWLRRIIRLLRLVTKLFFTLQWIHNHVY